MNCTWPTLTKGTPCVVCGKKLPRDYAIAPHATCKITVQPQLQPGLGDQVESLLSSIGITKDRYAKAKELFGLPPTCGCQSRQEWLNKVSTWWRGLTAAE